MSLDELNVKEKNLRFRPTASKVLFSSDSHIEDLRNEKSKMSSDNKGITIYSVYFKLYLFIHFRKGTKLMVIS